METAQKISDSLKPIIEQQQKMQELIRVSKPQIDALTIAAESMKSFKASYALSGIDLKPILPKFETPKMEGLYSSYAIKMTNVLKSYHFDTGLSAAAEAINQSMRLALSDSFKVISSRLADSFAVAIKSPMIEWLKSFDFSPIVPVLENLNFDTELLERYARLDDAYLTAMYESKWFPYAGWTVDIGLFLEVSNIIATSRGASKRREKRIDKAIFTYYTQKEIKEIKRSWKNSDLDTHIKKILGQAIDAHLRGEYALTITCLATMWEGLIQKRANVTQRQSSRKTTQNLKELVKENEFEPVFGDFYSQMIVNDCNTSDDVVEGVPNRNGVSHSKYKKYPNKKASLNAILLTDFIIGLKPLEKSQNTCLENLIKDN